MSIERNLTHLSRVGMHTSDGRTWSVAEDVVDEEETAVEEEEQWQAEAAAAESLVETALELVTVECRRCFHTFAEGETHYDPSVNHSVRNDQEARTQRMPSGGRKRARPEGGYARLAGRPVTFLLRYVGDEGVGR